ncbi:receptor activity-modifying protein 1 [Cynoglossus semilaevis]|uniref:receptor activity-modifying protein 1 n=1 Tax=Cynoglossus semilaevis TaxID=244447 RepID=UPI000497C977|nr:receptor activity-modifying protein 1-like [Cynoglossus semilaevis]
MISYLILSLLISGLKESQQTNTTEEETSLTRNQTEVLSPDANTTSGFSGDEKIQLEKELQDNETSVITEDEEMFLDQDNSPHKPCARQQLLNYSQEFCETEFYLQMMQLGPDKWCHLESISKAYSSLSICVEMVSSHLRCFYPNAGTQDFFIHIHSLYFQNCTKKDLAPEDAPGWVVMVLTLIPVSLIPVLVYLVVWKSKVQE